MSQTPTGEHFRDSPKRAGVLNVGKRGRSTDFQSVRAQDDPLQSTHGLKIRATVNATDFPLRGDTRCLKRESTRLMFSILNGTMSGTRQIETPDVEGPTI
jgi:hypothetical protein